MTPGREGASRDRTAPRPATALEAVEAPVREFFNRYSDPYERTWDLREHGLNVGIFPGPSDPRRGDDLEPAYQRGRDHLVDLLQRIQPLGRRARVLDVCCGTGATLAQVARRWGCLGVGVDISDVQIERASRLREGGAGKGRLVFRRGSASAIESVVGDLAPFTHALSQDGLLFAHDKRASIEGLFRLLAPGGALVISDFLPQVSRKDLDAALRARVYEDVKWAGGLSLRRYLSLLEGAGFQLIQVELRPLDMKTTYEKLAVRTRTLARRNDTNEFLAKRYEGIVKAVDNGALTWGWFAARKP